MCIRLSDMFFIIVLNMLLLFAIQTTSLYVSSDSKKVTSCGSTKDNPCRTIQAAIAFSKAGSQISIMASDSPTTAYHKCPIIVTKPLTFMGIQGTPVIDCEGTEDAFVVAFEKEFQEKKKLINFVVTMKNLKVRNAKRAIFYGVRNKKALLHFGNVTFEGNDVDINVKNSDNCSLSMDSVNASGSSGDGIFFDSCGEVKATLVNTKFHGKYLKVVSTNHKVNLSMKKVTFDMSTRSNTSEHRPSVYIEMAWKKTNIAISSSQFLNHGGRKYGSVYMKIPRKNFKNNDKVSPNVPITVLFEKVIFVNNSASAGNGGAFSFNRQSQTMRAYVKFKGCTFRENSAFFQGGALWFGKWRQKTIYFTDCEFLGNRANGSGRGQGGAIFASGGKLLVKDCRFYGNSATKSGGTLHLESDTSSVITDSIFQNNRNSRNGVLGDVLYANESNTRCRGNVTFDLQSANFQKSIVWFQGTERILIMSNLTRFICPKGYNYKELRTIPIRKLKGAYHFFGFNCTACQDTYYSVSRGFHQVNGSNFKGKCLKCPYGASCNGTIRALANFWGVEREGMITMVACPRGYCCDREPCPSYNSCKSHRSGTICGRCEDGFTEGISSTVCRPNELCSSRYAGILIFNVVSLLALLLFQQELYTWLPRFLLWNTEVEKQYRAGSTVQREENSSEGESSAILSSEGQSINELPPDYSRIEESQAFNNTGGYVKVFFYFYQVAILLRASPYSSHTSVANRIIEAMIPFLNFQFANPIRADCFFRNLTPITKTLFKNSVCYFVLFLAFILYLFHKFSRYVLTRWRYSEPYDSSPAFKSRSFPVRLTGAVMQTLLLSYVALTHLTITLLSCVQVDGRQVLQIDGTIACYSPIQIFLWLFFLFCIASFPFVLIFGRKLLISGRLSPRRFIIACFLPLVFLLYWVYRKFCGKPMRQTGEGGRDPFKDKILYILQHSYKTAGYSDKGTWAVHMRENWESVLMFRRLAFILVFLFVKSALSRAYLLFFLSLCYLIHHVSVHPFVNETVNNFETASLTVLVFFSGLSIAEGSFSTAGQVPPKLVLNMQTMQDSFIAFFPFLLIAGVLSQRFRYHLQRCRLQLTQSSLTSSESSEQADI